MAQAKKKRIAKKKRTIKKAPAKRTSTKPKFLVKDKKALLDNLLAYEIEQEKIDKAIMAAKQRNMALRDKRSRVIEKLVAGMQLNKEKLDCPILYKNKSCQIEETENWSGYQYYIEIKDIKKL